jgi:hypothetical protein
MSKLEAPEADFYEILQYRINMLEASGGKVYGADTASVITELKHMQQNFNSYSYRIRNKKQAD